MVGNEVELDVLRVAHGGVCVAELEGRVVFVPDAIPGERVLARVTDDAHDRYWRADTLRVLDPSPDRRPHVWAAASVHRAPGDRAGGAEFGHIDPARQRALKTEVLVDALVRTGGLEPAAVARLRPAVQAVAGPGDGTASRTRATLHVDDAGRVGPFAARSRRVVPVDDLPLAVPALRLLLPRRARGRTVRLVAAADGAVAIGDGERRPPIVERVGERPFVLEAAGFWQVHPAASETLTAAVRHAVDGRIDPAAANLDLYGGVGLFSAALAADAAGSSVTTVEADRRAAAHAAANLADLPGARVVAERVDRFLRREPGTRTGATVLLDPPRSGAGRDVVDAIARADPALVVYVACDPVALARDVRTFAAHGFEPERLDAFDLFPNTHHLEAVATLRR